MAVLAVLVLTSTLMGRSEDGSNQPSASCSNPLDLDLSSLTFAGWTRTLTLDVASISRPRPLAPPIRTGALASLPLICRLSPVSLLLAHSSAVTEGTKLSFAQEAYETV